MSTYPLVVTSPATTTRPVVRSVSTATRLCGSCSSMASSTESLIWSAILSGCPSVTDSEVNRRPATNFSLVRGRPDRSGFERERYPERLHPWTTVSGPVLVQWYVEQPGHLVPHDVGQGLLRAARDGD